MPCRGKLQYSSHVSHFHHSLLFAGKAGAYPSGVPYWTSTLRVSTQTCLQESDNDGVVESYKHASLL